MGGTGCSACPLASTQHQKCSSKPWNDFLKDIHAQSLLTTSSSGVLLKKGHDASLRNVLERARQIGLKLNLSKCKFKPKNVSFVGHTFTDEGLKPDTEKMDAIRNMPAPENQAALQRFLGMTNYLNQFIKDYSGKKHPKTHTHIQPHWRASPQRCRLELNWNPPASIWQTERWSHKSSCAEILRCRKACGVVCWRVQKRAWFCLPPRGSSSSLCFKRSFRCKGQICTDREGTVCGRVCMQKVSWLHPWSQSDYRNWSQAFDHHREEATSCCSSTLTENASSPSAVWPTVCPQEGKKAFPCWHPLKNIPGWTPRRDSIWLWRHDSAVHLSRQDDRASARNSGRCNHAEVGEVHQGRLAWTWAKCSTWRKTRLSLTRRARDWKWRHPERTKGSGAQIFAVDIHHHLAHGSQGADRTKQLASDVVYWPKMRQDIESAVFTWVNKNRVVKRAMLSGRKHIAETHNASNGQTTRSLVDISTWNRNTAQKPLAGPSWTHHL